MCSRSKSDEFATNYNGLFYSRTSAVARLGFFVKNNLKFKKMKTEVFTTCLGANGKMTMRKIERKVLPIGSRVYGELGQCYNESGIFYVYSAPDERGNQLLVEEVCRHRFANWDRYCDKPISQKFGIGSYWDDLEPNYRKTSEELERMFNECQNEKQRQERERIAKEEADAKEQRELVEKWKGILTPLPNDWGESKKVLKANIIAYMQNKFGVRFTAKKGYSTYRLSWTNGPTEEEVRQASSIFVDGHFNAYEDYMDYEPTNFTKVFGGIDWRVDTKRTEKEEPVRATKQVEPIKANGIEIIDYSDKAFAVIGDTKAIKDTLKELGGRFNFRLSCGAGWIFSKTKLEDVKRIIE